MLPDDESFFLSQLSANGEAHFRIFENLEHELVGNLSEVAQTITSFVTRVFTHTRRPAYEWSIDSQDGSVMLSVFGSADSDFPVQVNFWYSPTIDSNVRRDWRMYTCPDGCPNPEQGTLHLVPWLQNNSAIVTSTNSTIGINYSATLPVQATGWVASVTLTYAACCATRLAALALTLCGACVCACTCTYAAVAYWRRCGRTALPFRLGHQFGRRSIRTMIAKAWPAKACCCSVLQLQARSLLFSAHYFQCSLRYYCRSPQSETPLGE